MTSNCLKTSSLVRTRMGQNASLGLSGMTPSAYGFGRKFLCPNRATFRVNTALRTENSFLICSITAMAQAIFGPQGFDVLVTFSRTQQARSDCFEGLSQKTGLKSS